MLTRERRLIDAMDAFNKRFGQRSYFLGKAAVNNARLYDQLTAGGTVGQSVYERVMAFIKNSNKKSLPVTRKTVRDRGHK